jgi:hypothetical protein
MIFFQRRIIERFGSVMRSRKPSPLKRTSVPLEGFDLFYKVHIYF